jgi:hypothetical protein
MTDTKSERQERKDTKRGESKMGTSTIWRGGAIGGKFERAVLKIHKH